MGYREFKADFCTMAGLAKRREGMALESKNRKTMIAVAFGAAAFFYFLIATMSLERSANAKRINRDFDPFTGG